MTGNYYYINSTGLLTASSTFSGNNSFTGSNTFGAANGGSTFTSPVSGSWATQTCYAQFKFPATTVNSIKRQIPIHIGSSDVSTASALYTRYAITFQEYTGSGTPSDKFSLYMGQDGVIATRGAININPVALTGTGIATGDFAFCGALQDPDGTGPSAGMLMVRSDVAGAQCHFNYNNPSGSDATYFPMIFGPYVKAADFAIYQQGALFWSSASAVATAGLKADAGGWTKYPILTVTDAATQYPAHTKLYSDAEGQLALEGMASGSPAGHLRVAGEIKGGREVFVFTWSAAIAATTDQYIKLGEVTTSATVGAIMPRAGKVVGISYRYTYTHTSGGAGSVNCRVRINGGTTEDTDQESLAVGNGAASGEKSGQMTVERALTDVAFSAGAILSVFHDSPATNGTYANCIAVVQVAYDT